LCGLFHVAPMTEAKQIAGDNRSHPGTSRTTSMEPHYETGLPDVIDNLSSRFALHEGMEVHNFMQRHLFHTK